MSDCLLIVEDDEATSRLLSILFTRAGYQVGLANSGTSALEAAKTAVPDCVLMDMVLPDATGIDVAHALRNMPHTARVPIIFLTAQHADEERIAGLEVGDDYVTKPFNNAELQQRVRNAVKRNKEAGAFNPLTGLPGNNLIAAELTRRITEADPWSLLYIDFDNFKAYNDRYGFFSGDVAISRLAAVLRDILTSLPPGSFLGHIGGDDFVIATTAPDTSATCDDIISQFEACLPQLHPQDDQSLGHYTAEDRSGTSRQFPLLAISVGVVPVKHNFQSVGELSTAAAQVKRVAKRTAKSAYYINRREKVRSSGSLPHDSR